MQTQKQMIEGTEEFKAENPVYLRLTVTSAGRLCDGHSIEVLTPDHSLILTYQEARDLHGCLENLFILHPEGA